MSFRVTIACASALLAICVAGKAHAGPSNFQNSCNEIHIHQNESDAWITAICADRDGSPREAHIEIKGIENRNGHLVPLPDPREDASFAQSCPRLNLHWDHDRVVLSGECKDRDGNIRGSSELELENIINEDGHLRLAEGPSRFNDDHFRRRDHDDDRARYRDE